MKKTNLFSYTAIALLLVALCLCSGCSKSTSNTAATNSTQTITYKDTVYEIPKHPKRAVTLSNSLLQMIYAVNGHTIARTYSPIPLEPELESLPVLGHSTHINVEKLLSLKPDVVFGVGTQHKKLAPILDNNNIPLLILSFDGIHDNVPLLELFGKIYDQEDKANEVIRKYNNDINKVKSSIKNFAPKRVAVLFATGRAITAETNLALTASMIQELGMDDVVAHHISGDNIYSKTIPYSLETLAKDNPDVIFIVTMGKSDKINAVMDKTMISNPAWSQLAAVKNNKVFYLPSDKFLLNPGVNTPQAMAQLVKYLYNIDIKL